MNSEHDQNLETQLAELTAWKGSSPAVWHTALRSSATKTQRRPVPIVNAILRWPLPKTIAAALSLLLIGAIIASVFTTAQEQNWSTAVDQAIEVQRLPKAEQWGTAGAMPSEGLVPTDLALVGEWGERQVTWKDDLALAYLQRPGGGGGGGFGGGGSGGGGSLIDKSSLITAIGGAVPHSSSADLAGDRGQPSETDRQVIRKAVIELTTSDVRSAFIKAAHLISEAGSEYVQDSTITGSGKDAQANLTLRVAADRLAAVLNELRTLGEVKGENVNGEDVTAQVVDIEARLRNEQRIETELLQLLEKRNDAPLKEVLELRDHIGNVRQQIEQLTAQRERLGRLVSLATILVIIRTEAPPPPKPEEPKKQSIGEYFTQSVAADWNSGLRFLADTLSGTLRILIGGLFWWALLIAALIGVRHIVNRRLTSTAP